MQVDALDPILGYQAALAQVEWLFLRQKHIKVGLRRLRGRLDPKFVLLVDFDVSRNDVLSDALLLAKLECARFLSLNSRDVLLYGKLETRAVACWHFVLLPANLGVNIGASCLRAILIDEAPEAVLLGDLVEFFFRTGCVKLFRLGLHHLQLFVGGYWTAIFGCLHV